MDTGIGIPEETRDKIFDPFVQADTSVTRKFGGTGLGLAISRRFSEALGGELTVASELGKGSTFTFTVDAGPLEGVRTIQAGEIKQSIRPSASTNTIAGQLPGVRVLVVDDGDSNRKLITLVLGRAGAQVQGARHGKEAVDILSRTPADLVLMDMQMPVMDGYTATRLLREKGFQAPIIALTADAMKGTESKCRDAGCTGFLTKPIDMDKLISSLAEILQAHGYTYTVDPAVASMEQSHDAPTAVNEPIRSTLPTDDPDFCEIIAEFAHRLREKLAAMRESAARRELDQLAQLAHWLKGSGGTAGFPDFTAPAAELLELARAEADAPRIAERIGQIEDIAQRLVVPEALAPVPE
jgi:CheY-like chemotaxis protein/HPt (histidine-containing phosphotransfer) domain-containing protein